VNRNDIKHIKGKVDEIQAALPDIQDVKGIRDKVNDIHANLPGTMGAGLLINYLD